MLAATPSIGIIGGGISGLSCALRLRQLGFSSVVVYDTGARGVGGRASSRCLPWPTSEKDYGKAKTPSPTVVVDHAAQFFLAEHPDFKDAVAQWHAAGVVKPWEGKLGRVSWAPQERNGSGGGGGGGPSFEPFSDDKTRWIGTQSGGGIGGIATNMASKLPADSVVNRHQLHLSYTTNSFSPCSMTPKTILNRLSFPIHVSLTPNVSCLSVHQR